MTKTTLQKLIEKRTRLEKIEKQLEKLGLDTIAYQVWDEEKKITEQIDKLILGQ